MHATYYAHLNIFDFTALIRQRPFLTGLHADTLRVIPVTLTSGQKLLASSPIPRRMRKQEQHEICSSSLYKKKTRNFKLALRQRKLFCVENVKQNVQYVA